MVSAAVIAGDNYNTLNSQFDNSIHDSICNVLLLSQRTCKDIFEIFLKKKIFKKVEVQPLVRKP